MVQLPKRQESQSEFLIPDEGTYKLKLDRLSEVRLGKFADKDGNFHDEQEFYFHIIDDDDFDGCELREFVRVDTFYDGEGGGQPAKIFLIAKALLGAEFDPDEPPDTDELVGRKCLGNVTHKKSIALDGSTRTYARISAFMPVRQKRQNAARSVDDTIESVEDIPF